MTPCRSHLAAGALLGLGSVISGALLEHGATGHIVQQHAVDTALRYHQIHAILVTALGLILCYGKLVANDRRRLLWATNLLLVGTIIFCGCLYVLGLTAHSNATYGAPIGGMLMMAGWAALAYAALRASPRV